MLSLSQLHAEVKRTQEFGCCMQILRLKVEVYVGFLNLAVQKNGFISSNKLDIEEVWH